MQVPIRINGEKFEIRVQQRIVTYADVMYKGEVVASGEATLNPEDNNAPSVGRDLAVRRAVAQFDEDLINIFEPTGCAKKDRELFGPIDQGKLALEILAKFSSKIAKKAIVKFKKTPPGPGPMTGLVLFGDRPGRLSFPAIQASPIPNRPARSILDLFHSLFPPIHPR